MTDLQRSVTGLKAPSPLKTIAPVRHSPTPLPQALTEQLRQGIQQIFVRSPNSMKSEVLTMGLPTENIINFVVTLMLRPRLLGTQVRVGCPR